MKKKMFISLLLALLLCLSLPLTASALWDYGMIYDGTELLDDTVLDSYGRTLLPQFRDKYGAELRVDIVTESEDAKQTANTYFDSFLYGADTGGNCAVLTLCVKTDEGDISFVDGCVYARGEQWLVDAAAQVEAQLAESLAANAWSGGIEQDNSTCEAMLKGFYEGMEAAAQSSGTVSEQATEEEAAYTTYSGNPMAQLAFVTDEAGLLDEQQRTALEARAAELSAAQECGVYIVIVDDYSYYASGDILYFAESIFTEYFMGWGDDRDGIVLVLSMADRDYGLLAHGSKGNAAFTDYGKEVLSEAFLDNFRSDDWNGGLTDYVETAALMLQRYDQGRPVDVNDRMELPEEEKGFSLFSLLIILGVPSGVAAVVCGIFKGQMKTAVKKTQAMDYISPEGLDLRIRQDYFTHRTEHRELIQQNNNSSRGIGGGGTTVNSRGFSGRSGKF